MMLKLKTVAFFPHFWTSSFSLGFGICVGVFAYDELGSEAFVSY